MQLTPKDKKLIALAEASATDKDVILVESIDEGLAAVVEAIKAIPEAPEAPEVIIPPYPTDVSINNLPDVQKVEIINLPEEKEYTWDMSETNGLLKAILDKKDEPLDVTVHLDLV